MQTAREQSEFQRGWKIVASALIGIGVGLSPLPFYTLGIFREPLSHAFGWSPEEVMNALTVTSFVVLGAGPLAGLLADRWGVRRVVLASVALFGLSWVSLALSNGSLPLFYATWGAVAFFGAGTLPITWTRAVNNWFDRRKGLALGLSMIGTGIFGFLAPPLVNGLIERFGWRGAFVGLGLLPLALALPVALIWFHDRSPSTPDAAILIDGPPPAASGLTLMEALRQWRFWLIALALLPISFAIAGPIPNLLDMLKAGGLGQAEAIGLLQFIGLSVIAGRFLGGWLLDRIWAPAVALAILSLPALSFWILAGHSLGHGGALAAVLMIGFAAGIEYDIVAYFVARYFGMRSYAAIYGLFYVCFSLGAGLGPKYFARAFKADGDFHRILLQAGAALVVGAASFLLLGRYRRFAEPTS